MHILQVTITSLMMKKFDACTHAYGEVHFLNINMKVLCSSFLENTSKRAHKHKIFALQYLIVCSLMHCISLLTSYELIKLNIMKMLSKCNEQPAWLKLKPSIILITYEPSFALCQNELFCLY
jgi:hypothetical protein